MKKLFALSVSLVLFLLCAMSPSYASAPKMDVEDIRVDKLPFAGTEYAWFLVRCNVENTSGKAGTVSVMLRSIDKWAYDRKEVSLSGHLEAGEKSTLTVLEFMDYTMFHNLRKWQVKTVDMH